VLGRSLRCIASDEAKLDKLRNIAKNKLMRKGRDAEDEE
jgi:hypothetical protein